MITIENLCKKFGRNDVLKGINLAIEDGKITAVLGPNGSGKTTLIKSILGLVIADNGKITLFDQPVIGHWAYRQKISYLPQIARFPENLKVKELVTLVEDLRNKKGDVESLIKTFELETFLSKRLRTLSGGTRQKINLLLTFMFDCPLYILDEPTNGLDPVALIRLKDLIVKLKQQGKTLLITTHIMSLVEELADELVFLLEGNIYFKGTHQEMKQAQQEKNLERAIAKILEKEHV